MKIQDILFLLVISGLLIYRRQRLAVVVGMVAILLSMPLFYMKTALFTAQRLVMYSAGFFLVSAIQQGLTLYKSRQG